MARSHGSRRKSWLSLGCLFRTLLLLSAAAAAAAVLSTFSQTSVTLASSGELLQRLAEEARAAELPSVERYEERLQNLEAEEEEEDSQPSAEENDAQPAQKEEPHASSAVAEVATSAKATPLPASVQAPRRILEKLKTDSRHPEKKRHRSRRSSGKRVVVVIPFRDREPHLVKFKQYWRWFANVSKQYVDTWDIFVVEQFDDNLFARGWLFNVGFAAATKMLQASPDLAETERLDTVLCYVIQDIDYLPEQGVNYADCPMPTQFSSEIDRYNWGVPYPQSAGGIVGMAEGHWQKVNGFSNKYFGWGGEDDELHHRLRLAKLLSGNHIRRPSKGHGRFSGKFMHSMNHTKRVSDQSAYENNVKLLRQIEKGDARWKTDGLKDLRFRVVEHVEDTGDAAEFGTTYHIMKVRRGNNEHEAQKTLLAVPSKALCGAEAGVPVWTWVELGQPVPWDMASLQLRAADAAGCTAEAQKLRSFLLADLEWNLAKIMSDANPRGVHNFLRSVVPQQSALIVADLRSEADVVAGFERQGALWAPPVTYSVCSLKDPSSKETVYNFFKRSKCAGGVWHQEPGVVFTAYTHPIQGNDILRLCHAKHKTKSMETQRILKSGGCASDWAGVKWSKERYLYAGASGSSSKDMLCIGSNKHGRHPASRVYTAADCASGGWSKEFTFAPSVRHRSTSYAMRLCASIAEGGVAELGLHNKDCNQHFPVWTGQAHSGDAAFAVCQGSPDTDDSGPAAPTDTEGKSSLCKGSSCCPAGWTATLNFTVRRTTAKQPKSATAAAALRAHKRKQLCLRSVGNDVLPGLRDASCSEAGAHTIAWDAPSVADVVGDAPAGTNGMLTLLQEDSTCQSFICPDVLKMLK